MNVGKLIETGPHPSVRQGRQIACIGRKRLGILGSPPGWRRLALLDKLGLLLRFPTRTTFDEDALQQLGAGFVLVVIPAFAGMTMLT